jgi:hypothetical protein
MGYSSKHYALENCEPYGRDYSIVELDTPTNARTMPTKNDLAPGWLLGYER